MRMKTFSQKHKEVQRIWLLIDATDMAFGRVATHAARLLIGKGKPTFTPHVDGGDYVIIINTAKMRITGDKESGKLYRYHSGYPGGLRTKKISDLGYNRALEEAIRGMLPHNKLQKARLQRLKVYEGAEHNHTAQKPKVISIRGDK
jgi:large subunit ribosomal protein L13